MQKIWIDNNLLDYITVDKHKIGKDKYTIDIKFNETTCLSFVSNISTIFVSDNLYIDITKDGSSFSCVDGDSINLEVILNERNIYIVDSTMFVKNNDDIFKDSKSISIVNGMAFADPNHVYSFVQLFDKEEFICSK